MIKKYEKTTAEVRWTETAGDLTQGQEPLYLKPSSNTDADVIINTKVLKQEIEGFGGAFNEAGWDALSVLPIETIDEVMKEIFDPESNGTRLNLGRVNIGASDFALKRYSHNECPGDFDMVYFSIERDRSYLIPYIQSAMEQNTNLKIWASPFTPPCWMKDNEEFDRGAMLDDPDIYDAYALYLLNFVQAYKKEGILVTEIAIQNEPRILTDYPSCSWEPDQYHRFIKNHISPLLQKESPETGIMLGTFNIGNEFRKYIKPILSDPEASRKITSVGVQWRGHITARKTKQCFPRMRIVQTENECGNWPFPGPWLLTMPGFRHNPCLPQNDYTYAAYCWNRIRDYFKAGANSYYLWNIILDTKGWSNNSVKPWPQNAAVVVDRRTKTVRYTPLYRAFRHFSRYVEKGARYVPCITRRRTEACVFRNPDGTLVIQTQNRSIKTKNITIRLGNEAFTAELAPQSFQTFLVGVK